MQDVWIYTPYILRTGGKGGENKKKKEKRDDVNTEFKTSCVM